MSSYMTVEQMMLAMQQNGADVHVMIGQSSLYIKVSQQREYKTMFEFSVSDNKLSLYEGVKQAYERYQKIITAAPELGPVLLSPPEDASYRVVEDNDEHTITEPIKPQASFDDVPF